MPLQVLEAAAPGAGWWRRSPDGDPCPVNSTENVPDSLRAYTKRWPWSGVVSAVAAASERWRDRCGCPVVGRVWHSALVVTSLPANLDSA
jgi:hypothetical protein